MNEELLQVLRFPPNLTVTDQIVSIEALSESKKNFYVDLLRQIIQIYKSKQKSRLLVGVAGPIGSGKSVLAALLFSLAQQIALPFRFETLGIDAFHFSNRYLHEHSLKDYKGRFDTYDVKKLATTLQEFLAGNKITLPVYSRKAHEPIENATSIAEKNVVLVVEGLWTLYDSAGWEQVRSLLDFSIFVNAEKETVRDNVIKRHMEGGRSFEEASRYYDEVDARNFDLVMATKEHANIIIPAYYAI